MSDEKLKNYIRDTIVELKKQAKEAKKSADNPLEGHEDYAQGKVMGYYSIFTLLKHQAFALCMDQKELGLADINPDIDLLGLYKNPEIDFGEDNWAIDTMNEEKIKGYLSDTIALLLEQAEEAKKDADNPKEGFARYNNGVVTAYYSATSLLKQQAFNFNIDEQELGLSNI